MLGVLRIKDFRLLWGAGLVSSLGSWLLAIAVPAHVYQTTHSLRVTGLTLAAEYLPLLVLAPAAGSLADRLDRRRLMLAANLLDAGAVSLLFLARGPHGYLIVYASLAAESCGTAMFTPAQRALIPAITGTGTGLSSANSLNSATSGAVQILGGPLGGILYAFTGITVLIWADVASYLLSAAVMLAISPARETNGSETGTTARSVQSWRQALRASPMARALLPVSGLFLLANASLSAVLIPFAVGRLGGSARAGFVLLALGTGFLLGAPAVRPLLDRVRPGWLLAGSIAGTGGGYALLFTSGTLVQALPGTLTIGIFGCMALTAVRTNVQRSVPNDVLGRVNGVFLAVEAVVTLTGALAGPVLAQALGFGGTGLVASLVTAGAAILALITVGGRPTGALL
jgi:Na+/melibiose symporter-like transporter